MPKTLIRDVSKRRKDRQEFFLSIVPTSNCNIQCAYCFEKHELRDKQIMDVSIAKEAIRNYMEKDGYDYINIDFFGGEPFIAFDFIRDVVDWFHSQTWDKEHVFQIGTNGTILNEEIKEWLYKNRRCVKVGFSIDGTKIAHNLCRSNSYDLLIKNIPFYKKYWPNQPAKMTICAETIPYVADGVIELEEMDLLFTANMAFEDHWGDEVNKEKLLDIYEEQLTRLVDYYNQHSHLYPVSPLLTSIPEYLGIPNYSEMSSKEIKRFCGAGHEMVVVDIDGSTYPCHRFIPWITKKTSPGENANCQKAWKPEKCAQCKLIHSCPTCAGYNWEVNNDTGMRTDYHCESFKREVMASCLIEWNRLQRKLKSSNILDNDEKKIIKRKLDAMKELIDIGI
jgi:radical SAM protein with 4Fe4S-binding SPASM domain